MSTAAIELNVCPPLVELLTRQFSPEGLRSSLSASAAEVPAELWEQAIAGPLSEFLSRPGKEVRRRVFELGWQLGDGKRTPPPTLSLLVEVLHSGSLIVDDIEDGSSYRRGARALHCVHGVPLALNAGSWLYFWPAELLRTLDLPPALELELHRAISRTLLQAHSGQALDLSVRVQDLEQADVPRVVHAITTLKTGSLMRRAAEGGAITAGAEAAATRAAAEFGAQLGVGLQMLDDLSGIDDRARCHKGHEDLLLSRATWPWAWLAESLPAKAYAEVVELHRMVVARDAHPEALARAMRERLGPARPRVHATLDRALLKIGAFARPALLRQLRDEVAALEKSYG